MPPVTIAATPTPPSVTPSVRCVDQYDGGGGGGMTTTTGRGGAGGTTGGGGGAIGTSARRGTVTVVRGDVWSTATVESHGSFFGALAWMWCWPGSTGMAAPHSPSATAAPSRVTTSPSTFAAASTTTASRSSFGSIATMRAWANASKSGRDVRCANVVASL